MGEMQKMFTTTTTTTTNSVHETIQFQDPISLGKEMG